jgi:hypothetical protein
MANGATPPAAGARKGVGMYDLSGYREMLVGAHREAQAGYDKLCISLSTGSLGLSLTFWEKIAGSGIPERTLLVPLAWLCWLASALAVLFGYYHSVKHLSELIRRTDQKTIEQTRVVANGGSTGLDENWPKSRSARFVECANRAAGFLFALGAFFIVIFAWVNMEIR